jgi:nucleoid-associated protein YgaU
MARTQAPNGDESGNNEHFDAPDKEAKRIHRALDSFMHVETTSTPGEHRVHSGSGSTYTVNLLEGSCTCPDAEQSAMCKHMVRVVAVTGETPLSAGENTVTVTLTAAAFDEVASAVKVLDDAEAIVSAFGDTGDERDGSLTEQQCADVADAVKTAMGMSGPMGVDDRDAAADAREALETAAE